MRVSPHTAPRWSVRVIEACEGAGRPEPSSAVLLRGPEDALLALEDVPLQRAPGQRLPFIPQCCHRVQDVSTPTHTPSCQPSWPTSADLGRYPERSLLGPSHRSSGLRFGTSPCSARDQVAGSESPRAVPTFLLPVFRSRSAALSAGLERVHDQSALGPLVPRAIPVLGRRCRAILITRRAHLRR